MRPVRAGGGPPSPVRRIAVPQAIDAADLDRPGPGAQRFSFGGDTMGTTWSVHFYAPFDFTPGFLLADIELLLDDTIRQMSLWAPDSDINVFNRASVGRWVALPRLFFGVLEAALAVATETDGAFDPAMGALADLWGFGPSKAGAAPDGWRVNQARGPSWRDLELDPETRRVRQPGGLTLDLNAIAKGDAVDRLGALMNAAGLRVWLAEIGGELRGRGRKPDGSPWWARLETGPDAETEGAIIAALSGWSVATSGAYRRRLQDEGRTRTHIIDPLSGSAWQGALDAVTVLDPTCARADALATALMVMGAERGLAFAEARNIPALFTGAAGEAASPALQAMLEDDG